MLLKHMVWNLVTFRRGRSAEKGGPHQIKRKTAQNSSMKVSILLQEFPHWIFVFHCRLLTRSAILRVASTSVKSKPYFNVIVWIPHHQVTFLAQKDVGTRSHSKKRCGNAVPTRFHPTTHLPLERERQGSKYVETSLDEAYRGYINNFRPAYRAR